MVIVVNGIVLPSLKGPFFKFRGEFSKCIEARGFINNAIVLVVSSDTTRRIRNPFSTVINRSGTRPRFKKASL